MNVANVATLYMPVAMLIPLEQAFNHISLFNILLYFLYFFLIKHHLGPHSDDNQPEEAHQVELMEDLDIIYTPSF